MRVWFLFLVLVVIFGSVLCVRGEMTSGEFISFCFYNSMLISLDYLMITCSYVQMF